MPQKKVCHEKYRLKKYRNLFDPTFFHLNNAVNDKILFSDH